MQTSGIHTAPRNTHGQDEPSKNPICSSNRDDLIGRVIVGSKQEPLCILGNSTITALYVAKQPLHGATCLVAQTAHSNLPFGIIVNRYLAYPKAKMVAVILVNMNSKNIWIRQPLVAAEDFEVEYHSLEYDASLDK